MFADMDVVGIVFWLTIGTAAAAGLVIWALAKSNALYWPIPGDAEAESNDAPKPATPAALQDRLISRLQIVADEPSEEAERARLHEAAMPHLIVRKDP